MMKKPKLYVISIIIDSPVEEEELIEKVNSFCNSIPSNDFSNNISYCNFETLKKNRRLSKI